MAFRTSVPTCFPAPASSGFDRSPRVLGRDVLVVYVTALVYTGFDVLLFHTLSAWVTAIFEFLELMPILIGAWFYCRTPNRRIARLPPILYVPAMSVAIQLQLLAFAGFYRYFGSV